MGNQETAAVRQFNKTLGECPHCGWEGAAEHVDVPEITEGYLPWWTIFFLWFLLAIEIVTYLRGDIKYVFKRTKRKGGVGKLCGNCESVF